MIDGFKIIDVHVHPFPTASVGTGAQFGRLAVGLTGTVEELLPLMGETGIDRGVLLGATPVGDMVEAAWSKLGFEGDLCDEDEECQAINAEIVSRVRRRNAWVCAVAREYSVFVPFVSVDPRMGVESMIVEAEAKRTEGARGIKLHPAAQRFPPGDRRMWPVYTWAEENDIPVVFHTGWYYATGQQPEYSEPKRFADLLRDFPRLRVVLAHAGGGYWDQAIELAQAFSQVHFDTSVAFTASPAYRQPLSDDEVIALIRAFGAHRLLFGSEYPWLHPIREATRITSLPIADVDKRLILAENAQRVYGLD